VEQAEVMLVVQLIDTWSFSRPLDDERQHLDDGRQWLNDDHQPPA
jgi:hypothetical protein